MVIKRKEYLERLNNLKHKKLIKIVTGIRRCGKSTVLEMFRDQLLESGVKEEQIIFINFEDFENKELRDSDKLYEYVKKHLVKEMNYIFLTKFNM